MGDLNSLMEISPEFKALLVSKNSVKPVNFNLGRYEITYLWNAGSMEPESTTTMGDSDPVATINPFQIIKAEDTIIPKDKTWQKNTRKITFKISAK